jgi:hypothetical protein
MANSVIDTTLAILAILAIFAVLSFAAVGAIEEEATAEVMAARLAILEGRQ